MMVRKLLLCSLFLVGSIVRAEEIQFNRDVRPILSDKCYACHGPDAKQRKAELRLDERERATQVLGDEAVIVPGKPEASQLFQRITSSDEDLRMPPQDSSKKLTKAEIETLRRWIAEGAKYEAFWSFIPVSNVTPPAVQPGERAHNPIDNFILQQLRRTGLTASPEADKNTLLRRVYLDLIGLLPTPDESTAFASDIRPEAYGEVVERLLRSPHYGERWGRHWLDQARYADSNGYTIDADRVMWPYRDWVIRAHNSDMPFDQFTIEQLAGDLLPNATKDQRIASGFHRNTLINGEGGTDPEQFRIEAVMDRVATTGAVWLGLTVGCAQCHTHKYDPVSHREYYQLFAFFNQCADINNVGPTVEVHEGELFMASGKEAQRAELDQAVGAVEKLVALRNQRRVTWEQSLLDRKDQDADKETLAWRTLAIRSAKAEKAKLTALVDQSILATPGILREIYQIETLPLPSGSRVGSFRLRFIPHESLPKSGPGLASNGNLVLSAVEVYLGEERLPLISASADHAQKGYPVSSLIDDDAGTGWAINVEPGSPVKMNAEHVVVLTLGQPIDVEQRPLRFVLKHELNNEFNVGRVQFSVTEDVVDSLADPLFRKALMVKNEERNDEQKKLIDSKFDSVDQPLKAARKELEDVRIRLGLGPTVKTMVMQDLPKPRKTYLFKRGDFLQPDIEQGEIQANVLAIFPQLSPRSDGRPFDRLDYARSLVSKNHPLTARVTVNRVWMRYFGRGLVETENDFGSQGSAPTHPELLDWLAWNFMDRGWSLKTLHRWIVTSATYRQSSHARPDAAEKDPLNVLLARQNRIRLDAEVVRDVALHSSGKLSRKIGGPGVHPPQPDGVYSFTQNKKVWQEATGDNRYRRGMYTMFYRSAPYPTLSTFDTPDFQCVCTRRQRSNTPLQALTMANDEAMFELARELASRAIERHPSSDASAIPARIDTIFSLALCRIPTDSELELMKSFLQRQLESAPSDERTAWTGVARAVMNTDEFVTRE